MNENKDNISKELQEIVEKLIKLSNGRGFITTEELMPKLEHSKVDADEMEYIMEALKEAGIEIDIDGVSEDLEEFLKKELEK